MPAHSSSNSNHSKLSPAQRQTLVKLAGGGFIRLARYLRPGGNQIEYLSLTNQEFVESGLRIAKTSFQSLLAAQLIEATTNTNNNTNAAGSNPADPFGMYYSISETGRLALIVEDPT